MASLLVLVAVSVVPRAATPPESTLFYPSNATFDQLPLMPSNPSILEIIKIANPIYFLKPIADANCLCQN